MFRASEKDRDDQNRHDVHDLDHRVDRRAARVLVGIAHGVAGDTGLVGLAAFPAVVAFLDVLLRVVSLILLIYDTL